MKLKALLLITLSTLFLTACAKVPTITVDAHRVSTDLPNIKDISFVFKDTWNSSNTVADATDKRRTTFILKFITSMEEYFPTVFELNGINVSTTRISTLTKKATHLKNHKYIMVINPKSIVSNNKGDMHYTMQLNLYKVGSTKPLWGGAITYQRERFVDYGYIQSGRYLAKRILEKLNTDSLIRPKLKEIIMPPEKES